MKENRTRKIIVAAIMGALGYILMFFSFPILPFLPFLKIDFSDLTVFLTTFLYGPLWGIITTLVKTVLHYIQTGGDMGYPIGDVASFLASISLVLPVYYTLRSGLSHGKTLNTESIWRRVFAFGLGTLTLTVVMSVANYFVITPLYIAIMNFKIENLNTYVLFGLLPFNLIKGIIVSFVSYLVMAALLPTVQKRLK